MFNLLKDALAKVEAEMDGAVNKPQAHTPAVDAQVEIMDGRSVSIMSGLLILVASPTCHQPRRRQHTSQ